MIEGSVNESNSKETQNEFNSVYIELNTLKLSLEELKDMISDCKKTTYKHGNSIADLKENISKETKDRIN